MAVYWNTKTAQYRRENGTLITAGELLTYLQQSLDTGRTASLVRLSDGAFSVGTNSLATLVAANLLPVGAERDIMRQLTTWYYQMAEEVKRQVITLYMQGRGGRNVMTAQDWGTCGGVISDQFRFLKPFAQQVEQGLLSEAQIAARSAMEINSAREAYYRGKVRALGIPYDAIPAWPADGTCKCLSNCACGWIFEAVFDSKGDVVGYNCYWELNPAEHCTDCEANHAKWYPLFIEM